MAIAQALFTSDAQTWNTPECIIERVRKVDDVSLDPCSNDGSIVCAAEEWRLERGEDGLARPWSLTGIVYVNPPYDDLATWAKKMASEAARGVQIVALIPARTDTQAFHRFILPTCDAIAFWEGRLSFGSGPPKASRQVAMFSGWDDRPVVQLPDNPAPFPSCLPYWGRNRRAFAKAFESVAWIAKCR